MRIIKRCVLFLVASAAACAATAAVPQFTFKTLITFNGTNGREPEASLMADASGNLYGTTTSGGSSGDGTVFQVAAVTHALSTVVTFNATNGSVPLGGLLVDSGGNLYGTTYRGGPTNDGTIFQLAAGTHALSTLVTFNYTNGSGPIGNLIADASGNLFGTTLGGAPNGYGTVFQVAAVTHSLSTLATFNFNSTGAYPYGSVIADTGGNLYGTTNYGGNLTLNGGSGAGSIFKVAAGTHALSTLATFNNTNGGFPQAGLVADTSGNLYGTTSYDGANFYGTVFEMSAGTHIISPLVTFNGSNGAYPYAGLIIDASGNLYGTTASGGANSMGTVFEVAAGTHTFTTLFSFSSATGADPEAGLFIDASGNLYGTTRFTGGVNNGFGTVFELSPVPEPSSLVLGLLAVGGALLLRCRQRPSAEVR